ncbi:MAG: hypothetical protein IPP13_12870 [Kouleothrix sp.]|jgi:hypothetical protein|nr:hypothetical protein [Kouleothrix sp.]
MALLRAQPLTSRNHGLLNAAALGVLAAGLLVQVPRAVVALSSVAEALIRALVPASASPQGPGALVLLLALPTVYQLLLAIGVLYAYGAGTQGRPEDDRSPRRELAGLTIALACVAASAAQHSRPGWAGLVLVLPLLLQATALYGLLPGPRAPLVYAPALLAFAAVALLLAGRAALWPDLLLVPAIPALAFAIGRLLRLVRLQCGLGAHATMAVAFGFVLAYALPNVLMRAVGL